MRRSIRMLALTGAAIALIAAVPATAAAVSTSQASLGFPSQPVGSTSGTQGVSLDVPCSAPVVGTCPTFALDLYYVHISTTGDFASTSNCPNPLGPSLSSLLGTCTINVAFKPTAAGTRTGTLSTGTTDITGLFPGPTVTLTGTATAPTSSSAGGTTTGQRRKCKKHHKHRRHGKKCHKKKRR